MKKNVLLLFCPVILFLFSACKKQEILAPNGEDKITIRDRVATHMSTSPNTSPVVLESGNYVSSFGGGIILHGFTYPTTVLPAENGNKYTLNSVDVSAPNLNLISYSISGGNISLTFGTFVGGITANTHDGLNDYYSVFNKWMAGDTILSSVPQYSSFISKHGGNSNGLIVVQGQFIIDVNSPTNISIVNSDFIPTTSPNNQPIFLGIVKDSNHNEYHCSGVNGRITDVSQMVNGILEPFYDFDGFYLVTIDLQNRNINLTLRPNTPSAELIQQTVPFNAITQPTNPPTTPPTSPTSFSDNYIGVVQDKYGNKYYCHGPSDNNVIDYVFKFVNGIEVPFTQFENGMYLFLKDNTRISISLTINPNTPDEENIMQTVNKHQ